MTGSCDGRINAFRFPPKADLPMPNARGVEVGHRDVSRARKTGGAIIIRPMLSNKTRGVPRADDRRESNGIFWVRSRAPWRDLPTSFGGSIRAEHGGRSRWA